VAAAKLMRKLPDVDNYLLLTLSYLGSFPWQYPLLPGVFGRKFKSLEDGYLKAYSNCRLKQ